MCPQTRLGGCHYAYNLICSRVLAIILCYMEILICTMVNVEIIHNTLIRTYTRSHISHVIHNVMGSAREDSIHCKEERDSKNIHDQTHE